MTGWIVLVVVLVAIVLGYVLASSRAAKQEERRMNDGIAGGHQDTHLDPGPHPQSRHTGPRDPHVGPQPPFGD
ncbi:hypothetical protein [Nocardioides abyssi]|uniref:Secreted protein n=1 Tax=Nocardioides abyssi TaxID=3058370 RepID=A0ABT8EXQ9_9ACTN|nr:hypothetical protein [Nocardioides abyssi]MDN4162961.1 hypothetical protein [Nocardioides abyssi]